MQIAHTYRLMYKLHTLSLISKYQTYASTALQVQHISLIPFSQCKRHVYRSDPCTLRTHNLSMFYFSWTFIYTHFTRQNGLQLDFIVTEQISSIQVNGILWNTHTHHPLTWFVRTHTTDVTIGPFSYDFRGGGWRFRFRQISTWCLRVG